MANKSFLAGYSDFVTFVKGNAKALLIAYIHQKYPCALPEAISSR
ncbi:hypothetical protein [Lachnoclostridium sp. An181]|nr:hypothetical protein [Lachnoclostridium sp. An181]